MAITFTKCVLLLLSTFSFLFGVALIAVGSFAYVHHEFPLALHNIAYLSDVAIAAIIVGVIIAIMSFIVFVAGATANRCLLIFSFVVVLLLMCIELTIFIVSLDHRSEVESSLSTVWHKKLSNDEKCWLEVEFKCQGWQSPTDAPASNCTQAVHYSDPCRGSMMDYFHNRLVAVYVATGLLLFSQTLALIVCCILIVYGKSSKRAERQYLINTNSSPDFWND